VAAGYKGSVQRAIQWHNSENTRVGGKNQNLE